MISVPVGHPEETKNTYFMILLLFMGREAGKPIRLRDG
jgi:hypothetical protein